MAELTIRQSRYVALAIAAAGVLTTFVTEFISNDWLLAGMAGVLVSALFSIVELRYTVSEKAESLARLAEKLADSTVNAIRSSAEANSVLTQQSTDRIIKYFGLADAFAPKDWFADALTELIALKRSAEKKPFDRGRFQEMLKEMVVSTGRVIGRPVHIEIPDEIVRIARLKEIVESSESYVYAVTYDARDYLRNFWSKLVVREYVQHNLALADRGVAIERIFVVTPETLTGIDREKSEKLHEIIEAFVTANRPNIITRVISIEQLPESHKTWDTSFLISDDYAASESDGMKHGAQVRAYISFGDDEAVLKPLKDRFAGLRYYADASPGWGI